MEVSLRFTLDKTNPRAFDEFIAAAREVPEVVAIETFLGRVDVRLNVVARDMGHYQEVYRARILSLPHIAEVDALMLIATIKDSAGFSFNGQTGATGATDPGAERGAQVAAGRDGPPPWAGVAIRLSGRSSSRDSTTACRPVGAGALCAPGPAGGAHTVGPRRRGVFHRRAQPLTASGSLSWPMYVDLPLPPAPGVQRLL